MLKSVFNLAQAEEVQEEVSFTFQSIQRVHTATYLLHFETVPTDVKFPLVVTHTLSR